MLHLRKLKKSHKFSQIVQLSFAFALGFFIIQLWQGSLVQSELLLREQSQSMSNILLDNIAYGASSAIQNEQIEQLNWLVNSVIKDPRVISASIYNSKGSRIAFSHSIPNEHQLDETQIKQLLSRYPPFIKDIRVDNNSIGYVQLRLDESAFLSELRQGVKANAEQQQIMLLLAIAIGVLLSRALSYKRAAYVKLKKTD